MPHVWKGQTRRQTDRIIITSGLLSTWKVLIQLQQALPREKSVHFGCCNIRTYLCTCIHECPIFCNTSFDDTIMKWSNPLFLASTFSVDNLTLKMVWKLKDLLPPNAFFHKPESTISNIQSDGRNKWKQKLFCSPRYLSNYFISRVIGDRRLSRKLLCGRRACMPAWDLFFTRKMRTYLFCS